MVDGGDVVCREDCDDFAVERGVLEFGLEGCVVADVFWGVTGGSKFFARVLEFGPVVEGSVAFEAQEGFVVGAGRLGVEDVAGHVDEGVDLEMVELSVVVEGDEVAEDACEDDGAVGEGGVHEDPVRMEGRCVPCGGGTMACGGGMIKDWVQ